MENKMSLDVALYMKIDTGGNELHKVELFDANITHNLGKMADAAGLYEALWCPLENGNSFAGDILPALVEGYRELNDNPVKYKQLDSDNGWGVYDNFLPWVGRYMAACDKHPLACIWISK